MNVKMISVKQICSTIKNLIEVGTRKALPSLPATLMLCSLPKRPGLSAMKSVINITQAFKEAGIPTEPNEDGTPNLNIQLAYAIVTEIYRALREESNLQVAIAPDAIKIIAYGANAGGNVTVVGSNTNPVKGVASQC